MQTVSAAEVQTSLPFTPIGPTDRIYRCREAFTLSVLGTIREYLNCLREAVKAESYVSSSICKDEFDHKECATRQLEVLEDWLGREEINVDPNIWLYDSEFRSPISFFRSPLRIGSRLRDVHNRDRDGCGLETLADAIRRDGKIRLMLWQQEMGEEAIPVGREHLRYMERQRMRIPWDS
jgi:hypothetical protein